MLVEMRSGPAGVAPDHFGAGRNVAASTNAAVAGVPPHLPKHE
jgi:hypothetical protein